MLLQKLQKSRAIHPPAWLPNNTVYLTIMGSMAYGVSSDSSDMDLYGFAMPPLDMVFPHLRGEIPGFGRQIPRFEQWQEHRVQSPDSNQLYDFVVYSIVKFFHLCLENNPNLIDSLFTPRRCVVHSTPVAEIVRENRKLFLSKACHYKMRAYAHAQMSKIVNKRNPSNSRAADIEKHGYDTKFAYHCVRLLLEAEQIMTTHDLDLERDREVLKAIRRGEWTLEHLQAWASEKERQLEDIYVRSTLRERPDEQIVKDLLLRCLEHHYGSLDKVIAKNRGNEALLRDLELLIEKYR